MVFRTLNIYMYTEIYLWFTIVIYPQTYELTDELLNLGKPFWQCINCPYIVFIRRFALSTSVAIADV